MDEEVLISLEEYDTFVGVKFDNSSRSYFFGVKKGETANLNDMVVVETVRGVEVGQVVIAPIEVSKYNNNLGLKPVLRVASETDIRMYESNKKDAGFAMEICKSEVERLGLNMNLISAEYTLDKAKVIFSYLSDERVDFRELLKALAAKLRTRIELRQIGSRDKAKAIGGIGICGLPLCCSTFLNEFDGISISRAKNQMLAINIPKLSGHCGKLICCLKYEDDAYVDLKKNYPDLGYHFFMDKKEYVVTSINVISTIIKIEGPDDDIQYIPLDDFVRMTHFKKRNSDEEN